MRRRNGASTRCGRSSGWVRPSGRRGSSRMSRDSGGREAGGGRREGQTFRGKGAVLRHVNLVRLPHTVFALPFALVGVVLASYIAPITVSAVFWVVIAFTTARFAAMGFNRIVDREIDARNPRTRMREIPAGVMSVREAIMSVVIASALFVFAAWML